MSPFTGLSTLDVIADGRYIEDGFDPHLLTIPQLLGIFGYHDLRYPVPYTKGKLVDFYNEEFRPLVKQFRKERRRKNAGPPSDNGIINGLTGEPLRPPTPVQPVRRSSRRISRAPTEELASEPEHEPTTKRRRSSVRARGVRSKKPTAPPQVMEQSESEEVEEPLPRKVGKNKKTSDSAGTSHRRISVAEDSGWEDNNIFQSGPDSSSPARPSPARSHARKSSGGRKSVKQPLVDDSPPRAGVATFPQVSNFEPELPPQARIPAPRFFGNTSGHLHPEVSDEVIDPTQEAVRSSPLWHADYEEPLKGGSDDEDDFTKQEKVVAAVSDRIAEGGRSPSEESVGVDDGRFLFILMRFACYISLVLTLYSTGKYKYLSSQIGFCDVGKDTNSFLEEIRIQSSLQRECNAAKRTTLYPDGRDDILCPLPNLIPRPDSCTPCPDHATCTQYHVTCNHGYILRTHSLLRFLPPTPAAQHAAPSNATTPFDVAWKVVHLLNGLPGLGSVAFPPKCVLDPERRKRIGKLGSAAESMLGGTRGERLCVGDKRSRQVVKDEDGGEARRWGFELEEFRERDCMLSCFQKPLSATFDDEWTVAIQQLVQWGGVIVGEDSEGKRYIAHKAPTLSWNCYFTVKAREMWERARITVIIIATLILSVYALRYKRSEQRKEMRVVTGLVQETLQQLRAQEMAFHTDPVSVPSPSISSIQLRDLVLQHEHSLRKRERLWRQVERVVEENANVRANLEETENGDELRVWRWVGSPGVRRLSNVLLPSPPDSPDSVTDEAAEQSENSR
ncbi:hypothetical protein FISHEDRAFT_38542 [Fistulina hepatica ATCC 64428]|nr:hypothetical protein FISHEDRAFT_38542 [Fistulina hepatica ATCC 64428]